jgi:hypothetical protein
MQRPFTGLLFSFSGVNETELKKIVQANGGESSSIVSPKVGAAIHQCAILIFLPLCDQNFDSYSICV